MEFYTTVVRPVLDNVGHSEGMHHVVRDGLHLAESNPIALAALEKVAIGGKRFSSPRLFNVSHGLTRENTLQLGAGWDKPGVAQRAWHHLGFGGTVTGGVTPEPQLGNKERPRQHVVHDSNGHYVEVNFLGLNSDGDSQVATNLSEYEDRVWPVIVSAAYNNTTEFAKIPRDFTRVSSRTYDHADGFQLLISCPNVHGTDFVKLLHDRAFLYDMAQTVVQQQESLGGLKPTDIKMSGDVTIDQLNNLIRVCMDNGLGLVGINTSGNRDFKAHFGMADVNGGFSGDYDPYRSRANEVAAFVHNETNGKLPFTASGAIYTPEDALQRHLAGASTLEMVTAMRINGLGIADRTNRYLDAQVGKYGQRNITNLVGLQAANYAKAGYPHISKE